MAHLAPSSVAVAVLCGCAAVRSGPDPELTEVPAPAAATVTVVQRTAELVPGFDGRLRVRIGDVTGGQVLVRVVDTETLTDIVPQRSMRVGDAVRFEFGGREHALGVARMMNRLIGDDFVEFEVGSPDAVGSAQIEALLQQIASSRFTFVRGGIDYDGPAAADHLRRKWGATGTRIRSAERFIDEVATRSETTGEEYTVRGNSDHTLRLADWLRGRTWDLVR